VSLTTLPDILKRFRQLKAMVGGDYIELCNDVSIEVHTNSF
jgi:hypothetical protein